MSGRFATPNPAITEEVLTHIGEERERQVEKWGEQSHPNGTGGQRMRRARDLFREICDYQAQDPKTNTWLNILREETYEAFAEPYWPELRKELIQAAAVIVAWVEDGDIKTYLERIDLEVNAIAALNPPLGPTEYATPEDMDEG